MTDALNLHKKLNGKIEISSKMNIKTKKDLSLVYTPGVAEVCRIITDDNIRDYTMKGNSIAVVSDGSAVLGLGNIGAKKALPVMEGKAMLFKEFAGIDAVPICLDTQDTNEIIKTVKIIAPVFGGINLEDISAPRCFEIENRLQDIGIPVMHDDQHGTAIVVLAGLINAAKVVGKEFSDLKIVVNGAGAAGTAITRLLMCADYDKKICTSVSNVIICDSKGIINSNRDLNEYKKEIAKITNKENMEGILEDAIKGSDVFIGVSAGNTLTKEMIGKMSDRPIVFAMANPVPEIMPDKAKEAGAVVVATGRSDFSNQVNNVLAFPGVFRGALDARSERITDIMKLSAAYALADTVENPNKDKILPDVFDKNVVKNVSKAVRDAE